MNTTKNIISGTYLLAIAYLISRFLGLFREMVIAWKFGAQQNTDVYNASFLLPDILNYFLAAGAFGIVLVPMLTKHREDSKFTPQGSALFSSILFPMAFLIVFMVTIAEIFTPQLTAWLYPDFQSIPEKFALTVKLTRILLPAQIFFVVGGLLNASLRARGDFRGSLGGAIYNLGIILGGVVLGTWLGITGFGVGALIGAFLGPFFLPFFLSLGTFQYQFSLNFTSPAFKNFIKLNLPLMLGISLLTVDEWLGRYLGAMNDIPEGTITCLRYARTLMLVPVALVGQTTGQASLTYLSQLLDKNKPQEFMRVHIQTLQWVMLISFILAGAMIVCAFPLVSFIFQQGAFHPKHSIYTGTLLCLYSLGIPAFAAQSILLNGYYARNQTLRPMCISSFITICSIGIYLILKNFWKGYGLALAASISFWCMFLATLFDYFYCYGAREGYSWKSIVSTLGKTFFISCLAGGLAQIFFLYTHIFQLSFSSKFQALYCLLIESGVYFGLVILGFFLFARKEYRAIKTSMMQFIKRP